MHRGGQAVEEEAVCTGGRGTTRIGKERRNSCSEDRKTTEEKEENDSVLTWKEK